MFQSRVSAVAAAASGGTGKNTYLSYTPAATDHYGFVVLNNGATTDTAYYIDVAPLPFLHTYVPAVFYKYSPPCDLYDPNETDATRYGPLLSGVNYQARLCYNDIDKYKFTMPSAGTVHISITVPSSLLQGVKDGASIAVYPPTGTSGLANCTTPSVGGYTPLTKNTTVFSCPITSAGTYRLNVYSTMSTTIFDNINYYNLRLTYP